MRAIVWTKYGPPDVLKLREVAKPVPKDNEVLIRVHATDVFAGDCELRSLMIPILIRFFLRMYIGLARPKRVTILGQELAGEIEALGKDVSGFKKGDQIFTTTGFRFGAYAEYACLPEDAMMALKPTNMTYEEATVVPVGGTNALHFLRLGDVKSGQRILINGAGGGIGTMAIQLAKSFGAEVTAVDRGEKLEMLTSIGADKVIDYTKEDYTRSDETYDVIFDVVGKSPFRRSIRSLNKHGVLLLANNGLVVPKFQGLWTRMTSSKRVISKLAGEKKEDLVYLRELIEAGKIRSVIDRTYRLEEMVDAHRYVDSGQKKGNVVITVVEQQAEGE
jgi:NADPH:quinone reductase-like Zn-dependent oxidoreductase